MKPEYTKALVSLRSVGKEGQSEIQATYGGFFVGIALYALADQSVEVFTVIGCGWMFAAGVRLMTFFNDQYNGKNLGAVVFESIVGVLCLSAFFT